MRVSPAIQARLPPPAAQGVHARCDDHRRRPGLPVRRCDEILLDCSSAFCETPRFTAKHLLYSAVSRLGLQVCQDPLSHGRPPLQDCTIKIARTRLADTHHYLEKSPLSPLSSPRLQPDIAQVSPHSSLPPCPRFFSPGTLKSLPAILPVVACGSQTPCLHQGAETRFSGTSLLPPPPLSCLKVSHRNLLARLQKHSQKPVFATTPRPLRESTPPQTPSLPVASISRYLFLHISHVRSTRRATFCHPSDLHFPAPAVGHCEACDE